jgi:hypothetical protein
MGILLVQRAPASPADTAMGFARSCLLPDLPPPAIAALRSTVASQKSRLASIAVIGRRNALARLRQQREHVDQHRVVAKQRFVGDDLA